MAVDKEKERARKRRYANKLFRVGVNLNPEHEQDVIDWLKEKSNKKSAIVELIKAEIARSK